MLHLPNPIRAPQSVNYCADAGEDSRSGKRWYREGSVDVAGFEGREKKLQVRKNTDEKLKECTFLSSSPVLLLI